MSVAIAVDCMGGDHGARVTVPAALGFLEKNEDCSVFLVGNESAISNELKKLKFDKKRVSVRAATEVVTMQDEPTQALRGKRDSSMRVTIDLVKEGLADAAVSAGNTGALMGISRFVLKMLPGIQRPAIASLLPSLKGHTCVLDLGANVKCEAEHFLQFGVMGACLFSAIGGKARPSIGLLNIGEEDIKGNEVVKAASDLLKKSGLNFAGNVEGSDIYIGQTDVIVCDGFVGNVALKTSEGLTQMLAQYLKEEFNKGYLSRFAGLMALPVIKQFRRRVDHRRYNGASLLGLKGIVVKSHGAADSFSFEFALEKAVGEVKNNMLDEIAARMSEINEDGC